MRTVATLIQETENLHYKINIARNFTATDLIKFMKNREDLEYIGYTVTETDTITIKKTDKD